MPRIGGQVHRDVDHRTSCDGQLVRVYIRRVDKVYAGIGWVCLTCGVGAKYPAEQIARIRDGEPFEALSGLEPWRIV